MFTLVTAIVIVVFLVFNLAAACTKNMVFQFVNLVCCFLCVHLFFNIFNIFGSVWLFSDAGKYYPSDCPARLITLLKDYLIVYWCADISESFLISISSGLFLVS
jgi:hypothetical protein